MLIRKSNDRGKNQISWLNSWHSFSFGHYYDPNWQGFYNLLVINEDIIAPEMGFGTHPHRNMEIITFVISGELRHQDSMGNLGIIKPGEIQVMSAGTGITHSEHNNIKTPTHLLQIWVLPNKQEIIPRYDQKIIYHPADYNFIKVIAAPFEVTTQGVSLNSNSQFWLGRYNRKETVYFKAQTLPHFWIQMIKGEMRINDQQLNAGDALGFHQATNEITINVSEQGAEFLIIEVQ